MAFGALDDGAGKKRHLCTFAVDAVLSHRGHAVGVVARDHFDAAFARQELSALNLMYLNDAGFRKIATDVGTHEMFGWLQEKGFELYGSHFLTARNPAAGKEPDLTRLKLLKLLNIVKQDGNTREIEAIFREEPKLSYNLLRLVNSVAVGARTKISSFSQAIAILGRRQLQRWLQLLVYSDPNNGQHPIPLLQKAAARGRLIELLVPSLGIDPALENPGDMAFMIGTFSLLDTLLNMSMGDILHQLPLPEIAQAALGSHAGKFGALLAAIEAADKRDLNAAASQLTHLGIAAETYLDAQLSAISWAAKIRPAN